MNNDPFLRDLEVEVEADIELNAAGTPPEGDIGSPGEWLLDPVEVQQEAVDLRSLRGAIEALEGDPRQDPGATVSSG
jgi:hypothetical protein